MNLSILQPLFFRDLEVRCERKFQVLYRDHLSLKTKVLLHPFHWSELYPSRYVNSVYFDTHGLNAYQDNLFGSRERWKIRLRWYGEDDRPAAFWLEIKMKQGVTGTKFRVRLEADQAERLLAGTLSLTEDECALAHLVNAQLGGLRPVLMNTYLRSYLASSGGELRMTIDEGLSFHHVNPAGSFPARTCNALRLFDQIMEIKYHPDDEWLAAEACQHWPYRLTRHSKYVRGVEKLGLAG